MKTIKLFVFAVIAILMNSCAVLKSPTIVKNGSLDGYRYIYLSPTKGLSSSMGIYGGKFGASVGNRINPEDIITGALIKKRICEVV